MNNINELFQNYGLTGIPAIDTIILAHIIPLLVSYISFLIALIKNFLTTIIADRFEKFYGSIKNKMLGTIDMRLCVSQDKSIYPTIRSILFSPSVTSDVIDQKTIGVLALITESKHSTYGKSFDNYYNTYDLFMDSSNNITVEKKTDLGSSILKKYFKFNDYYIVVSENKKTDFSQYYSMDKEKGKVDETKKETEHFILFEAIKSSKNTIKDNNIISKFLEERFKLKTRIPYKYLVKIENHNMKERLSYTDYVWKSGSSSAELNISDGIDTFLANPKVKEFYDYINDSDKNKRVKKSKGLSSNTIIKHNGNLLDLDTLDKDIILADGSNVYTVSALFEPSLKSIISYFFGTKFDLDKISSPYFFYFKGNKIIFYICYKTQSGVYDYYIGIISFQEMIDKTIVTNILTNVLDPSFTAKEEINQTEKVNRKIRINTYNSKWNPVDCESRSYDTIYLPIKMKQLIISEMDKFLCYEKIYKEIGVPYKKGFLFYGPPGTGKTSLVRALANKYSLPIYIIDINNEHVNDDSIATILNSISGTGNRIVLFEDIDSAFADKEQLKYQVRDNGNSKSIPEVVEHISRESSPVRQTNSNIKNDNKNIISGDNNSSPKKFLTYSGLLNALDGVLTSQHGTIVIMTTNYKEKLGDALVRPGRIDFHFELTYCDRDQIIEMTKNIICKSYAIINAVSTDKKKKLDMLIEKIHFNNPYTLPELESKIELFADNIMKESIKSGKKNNISVVKPCELQIYILKYLDNVDNIFEQYSELIEC